MESTAQGGSEITISGDVQKTHTCSTWEHCLMLDLAVLG